MTPTNQDQHEPGQHGLAKILRRVVRRYYYAIATILFLTGIALRLVHSAFHVEGVVWDTLGDLGTFLALIVSIHFVYELSIKREERELFLLDLEDMLGRQKEKPISDLWDYDAVYEAMAKADPHSTISILQTSIPDATRLIAHLERLLINESKRFQVRIMLIDYSNATELIAARMRLRLETPAHHIGEVQANIEQLVTMKGRVDSAWRVARNRETLDLEIRLYNFLPFGSHYQIGNDVIFIGLFWNTTSSINGPMIKVTKNEPTLWQPFEKQFSAGWDKSEKLYPRQGIQNEQTEEIVDVGD